MITPHRLRSGYRRRLDERINARLAAERAAAGVALNLGSGTKPIPGVINCDLHSELADRRIDALDLSDFESGSVDLVEHHHLLEHLSIRDADAGFDEWWRVLRPGGLLVITCPDLDAVARTWLRAGPEARRSEIIHFIYGSQEHPGMYHRSGYDRRRLVELLRRRGFEVVFWSSPFPKRATPSIMVVGRKPVPGRPTPGPQASRPLRWLLGRPSSAAARS